MLRERAKTLGHFLFISDIMITIIAFFTAFYLRQASILSEWNIGTTINKNEHFVLLIIIIPIWAVLLKHYGAYNSFRKKEDTEILWIFIKTTGVGIFLLGTVIFFLQLKYTSRIFILLFGSINLTFLVIQRLILQRVSGFIRNKGLNYRTVLVVGTGKRAREFTNIINLRPELGLKIIGYVDDDPVPDDKKAMGDKIIGQIKDIPGIVKKEIIDEVVIAVPRRFLNHLQDTVHILNQLGIQTIILADLFDMPDRRANLTRLDGMPLLTFSSVSHREWDHIAKIITDYAGGALLLILLSPLLLLTALAIRLSSPGPVLFKQTRIGLFGRRFQMYKFRSMINNAEEIKKDLEHLNEMSGPIFKIKKDPRITPIGRFLRKTSLDELPQLINVLKGEMSLVGPRPPLPDEVDKYETWHRKRLSVKPGLTCLWQIYGRNKIDFEKWMELDLRYIDNRSFGMDLKILFKTIPVVLLGIGAK
ncbi:MAG: sugar transferase [Nitrospinota bacterium]